MDFKSFIYLDEYKMYSISSQLFEGLTEYIIKYDKVSKSESEEQKGPVGSGKILADIISSEKGKHEKKFLNDYSYTIFENELIEKEKVLSIDENNINSQYYNISKFNFIKITGKITFNDINIIRNSLESFNDFGTALTFVTTFEEMTKQKEETSIALKEIKDRNKKTLLKNKFKNITNIKKLAKENGLYQDEDFVKNLSYLLEYGYKDQFEIQIPLKITENDEEIEKIFSAILNREFLKENENSLIKKYSRITEKKFTLFGTVTQCTKLFSPENEDNNTNQLLSDSPSIKEAIMNIISALSNLESTFIGRMPNEIIIDPIAIYREV